MAAPMVQGPDEADLVRIAQHDPEGAPGRAAAAELLGLYRLKVYRWCRRFTRDHETALDLSQDVLLSAYRALGTYAGRAPFGAWLFTIARHRCIRAVRQPPWTREDLDVAQLVSEAPSVDAQVEVDEEYGIVVQVIDECLTLVERRVLLLRCVERLPVDEITRLVGVEGASGARGVLQTARRKLRAAMSERGIELEEGGRT